MSFHIKRTRTKDQKPMIQYNGIRSTIWATPEPGKSVREIQTTHTPTKLQEIPDELNYLTPPPHWHWYQDEYFYITEGRYIFTLEGQDKTISASDPQPQRIPAGARHTFKVDDTCESPCTIEISTIVSPRSPSTSPEEEGANEKFFRNIYSYLDDCYVQGVSPKLPQLLLFLDSAEVSLALPGPASIAKPVSWLLGVVVGRWIGGYLLGYKASYDEYWNDDMKKVN
ncbi:Putative rmlC-like cupin domain superfamily, rmlC-like jelly roll protein [Septoria linicola]|uniref:RmlC-like cupin domain superfamily, rmlC-like jelly roll protein n=1 Tax=Septoria linicola TaxID=215465 RepID=A0A9Q9AMQ8_9PEZI|nr:putative rmlC-like cupin domain superfamily, rmlC-like jelly roll protein [Septoria linicola]USW49778.1 Putative rmlC-like cupin domain superfamily, rmlC-like jelly roll protein [Septoria linicola]